MSYTKLFYWLTVADNAKDFFLTFTIIFTIIAFLSTIAVVMSMLDGDDATDSKKWMWWSYPFMILFWSLYIFTPSKKDALLIVAGGQTLNYLTTNETAKQLPQEALTFVVTELKSMAADAKVELGIQSQKEKMLEEVKSLSAQQLIEKMRVDTVLARVILDK